MTRTIRTIRTTVSAATALAIVALLGGCALLDEPKQAACDALTTKLDDAAAQFSAATGGAELSVTELGTLLDTLEQENPEVAQQLRDGNFSGLLEGSGLDIEQLEAVTGIPQLGELVTPENLAALDGVGGTLIGALDQVRTVCSF